MPLKVLDYAILKVNVTSDKSKIFASFFNNSYFISLKINPQTARLSEILTPNSQGVSDEVNSVRKSSIANPLTNLLTNKYSICSNIILTKLLKTFATDCLFISGDEFFSIRRRGLFYYIYSLFIILGALFMFVRKRRVLFAIILLILIGTVPQVFHTADTSNFSIHATLTYPFLILIRFGIFRTLNYFKNKKIQAASLTIILVLYAVSATNFFNIYIFWYPIQ